MTTDLKAAFWDRLDDVRTGLLDVDDRRLPMSPKADADAGCIWFITARGTPMAEAAAAGADSAYSLCDDGQGLYGTVKGRLSVSNDAEKLDEVFGLIASSWFEEGKDDPDLMLIRFDPSTAELWVGKGTAAFFYQIAKAQLTGDTPDLGDHGTVMF